MRAPNAFAHRTGDRPAVLGAHGLLVGGGEPRFIDLRPASLCELGAAIEPLGVGSVWVHESALYWMGFPPEIPHHDPRAVVATFFTDHRGEWRMGGAEPGLRAWAYWYRPGGFGFDLHVPAYGAGRNPFAEAPDPYTLLEELERFTTATGGVAWKGTGAVTSDVWLRRRLRRVLAPTELPPPVASGAAHEVGLIWHRQARTEEARARYCHALDLNMAWVVGASSVELPTGPARFVEWPTFDKRLPGVYRFEPGPGNREWVTAPTAELLTQRGLEPLEAWIWERHGRHLRPWYEMLRDARAELLEAGGPSLEAVKMICHEGLGRMAQASRTLPRGVTELAGDPNYQPYWAWAVIAEVRARLERKIAGLELEPVAVDRDALYFLSSRRSPEAVAEQLGLPLGRGLGQWKAAGTCSAREAREALELPRTSRAVGALRELVK